MSYKIFGMEVSPYSIKVRSYFRYKQLDHEWIIRGMDQMETFQKYAKLPLVPTVVTPSDEGLQDSTPIIDKLEVEHSENSIVPEDRTLAFLSRLIEEYADEWVNKSMFHYRWAYADNVDDCAMRIAKEQMGSSASDDQVQAVFGMLKERMTGRLHVVGSSELTAPLIEASYANLLVLLEKHFSSGRKYLFGGKPVLADFGLYAQIYQHYCDPVGKAMLDERAPLTRDWCLRMLDPKHEGGLESLDELTETLLPLLKEEIAQLFLPWAKANSDAAINGEGSFSVELEGGRFEQNLAKYSVKSYAVIKAQYQNESANADLNHVLESSGALIYLQN